MQIDNLQQLNEFLERITSETNIKPTHFSLYTVLCLAWLGAQCVSPFIISRRMIMDRSMIKSKATHHSVINDLQKLGYIKYNPSSCFVKRGSPGTRSVVQPIYKIAKALKVHQCELLNR